MAQKKNEEQNEKVYVTDSIMNPVWDQYEATIERVNKLRDNQSEAYVKAVKETTKFNSEFRQVIKSFYEETKNANETVFSAFTPELSGDKQSDNRFAFFNQQRAVTNQWANLMLTPMKYSFSLMERVEQLAVENNQALIENIESQRKERLAATDNLVKLKEAREAQQKVLQRVEDSFKVLMGTAK